MKLLAIDPGIRGCGCALFERELLTRAWYAKNTCETGNGYQAAIRMVDAIESDLKQQPVPAFAVSYDLRVLGALAIEYPQVYADKHRKGDPNDLLPLVAIGSALASRLNLNLAVILEYKPKEWKGQLKKDICEVRINKELSIAEKDAIVLPSRELAHNVYDAIGIGLYSLGRFKAEKVYAR